jgi:hypothetical protein
VVPLKQGLNPGEIMTPDDLREIIDYIHKHRVGTEPFDVVVGGPTPGNSPVEDAAIVAPYIEAGATWWFEDISPWATAGWQWGKPWPLETMRKRINNGPPK